MLLDLGWRLLRPLLFQLDAERAHSLVLEGLSRAPRLSAALLGALVPSPDPRQAVELAGLRLSGPVGLAAGLDKDGLAIPVWAALGFGFIEVGTVTPRPQAGNPGPRMFRLVPERAIINRMGFNNAGVEALAHRLRALRDSGGWPVAPVGANIGRNKDTPNEEAERDYLACVTALHALVDYFTVNVSSPNTPDLRALQEPSRLRQLLGAVVVAAHPRPVLLKLAPDLLPEELGPIVDVAVETGCAGIIATNTTISRPGSTGRLNEAGGLSGAPLWPLARTCIGEVLAAARGRLPVVGVGGISGPEQASELLGMGCRAVQVYSGLIYEGPGLAARIHAALPVCASAQHAERAA